MLIAFLEKVHFIVNIEDAIEDLICANNPFVWGNLSNHSTYDNTFETLEQNLFTPLYPLELLTSSSLSFVPSSEKMGCFLSLSFAPLQRPPDSKSEEC